MLVEHYATDERFEELLGYLPELAGDLKKIDGYLRQIAWSRHGMYLTRTDLFHHHGLPRYFSLTLTLGMVFCICRCVADASEKAGCKFLGIVLCSTFNLCPL